MKPPNPLLIPDFNRSIRVEADPQHHTSSDSGGILMRSVLDKTKILDVLLSGLFDLRIGSRIRWRTCGCNVF